MPAKRKSRPNRNSGDAARTVARPTDPGAGKPPIPLALPAAVEPHLPVATPAAGDEAGFRPAGSGNGPSPRTRRGSAGVGRGRDAAPGRRYAFRRS